ncbi:hypothetical protein QP162_04730 [Sphingomonas aurantiaca]|uniref:hypothetical protein n=1 Tax=Sphingomonas aurantiaca TaxID=185949 RepID=UPI002FE01210
MRQIGRKFALFVVVPIIFAMICVIGLNGDLSQIEALVPVYLIGLIFAFAAVGAYVIAVLVKAIRWIAASVR